MTLSENSGSSYLRELEREIRGAQIDAWVDYFKAYQGRYGTANDWMREEAERRVDAGMFMPALRDEDES